MAGSHEAQSKGPHSSVMGTYRRTNVVFERGEGSWLIAQGEDRYLDFASGVAVNALGHAHPDLIKALTKQASKLWHTSNLYRIEGQERLAALLCENSFAERVFFCNSGAEACEGAIKIARRYHFYRGNPQRYRIITFEGCFHGRTLATLSASGNPKYLDGFAPETPGFDHVPFADHDALKAAVSGETAAIMIEPVMGEGGIRVIPKECLQGLRMLCDQHGLLFILDEVQTGVGRTGKLFAHEWAGIKPDVMAIAKGIGGGFPLGAVMATEKAAEGMVPGTHGSTFGGNPLAMAVGCAVLEKVLAPSVLEEIQHKAQEFRGTLERLKDRFADVVEEVRGLGLLLGLKMRAPAGDFIDACFAEKLLTVMAGDNVVRLIPPLNVAEVELTEAVERLTRACERVRTC